MTTDTKALQTSPDNTTEASESTRDAQTYSPRADIIETGDSLTLIADMPGVSESDVEITLEKNVLTIQGQVSQPEHEGFTLVYSEYPEGSYERSFALSEDVDRDNIAATVSNGVLRLTLPKSTETAARKIPVHAG